MNRSSHLSLSLFSILAAVIPVASAQDGGLTLEQWNHLAPGNSLLTLEHDGIARRAPDETSFHASSVLSGPNLADNHGVRLRGTVTAPATGSYTFFIAGDDSSDLWLAESGSSRFDLRKIAFSSSFTAVGEWNRYGSQRSHPVFLTAGESYAIEARMRDGGGADHLAIGWHYAPVTPFVSTAVGPSVTQEWDAQTNGDVQLSVESVDIWGSEDSCGFYHRTWTGDGEVVARVHGLNSPHPYAKVGLMFRAGTDPGAANAMIARTPGIGEIFQRRNTPSAGSTFNYAGNSHPWLKLVRQGEWISAYVSADGVQWYYAGSDTFPGLPATLEVGIAATDHYASTPVTATVSDLAVRPLSASESIPSAQLHPLVADPDDEDDDGLPDLWALTHGISHPHLGTPVNWALEAGVAATQSSTGWEGAASRAIDGNTSGDYSAGSVTHTESEADAWWRCEFAGPRRVARVVIHNRDIVQYRLCNFRVSILDASGSPLAQADFHTHGTHTHNRDVWDLPQPVTGHAIVIERIGAAPGGENFLCLAEVEILDRAPLTNWARQPGAYASQSSTGWGGDAQRAIDGNPNGDYSGASVTHTENQAGAWWRCDLGTQRTISSVLIRNRSNNLEFRLSNYRVTILDAANNPVHSRDFHTAGSFTGTCEEWVLPYPVIGNAVVIERLGPDAHGTHFLSLAEVEIFNHCPALVAKRYGRHGDFDQDGIDNLTEYQLDLEPTTKQTFPGVLTRERWLEVGGSRLADFIGLRPRSLGDPCQRSFGTSFSMFDQGDYFATRQRGCITPTRTGLHTFWISGDDEAELWLATGDAPRSQGLTNRYGKQRIASVINSRAPGYDYTAPYDFDAFPSQRSRAIHLTAGVDYYIEVLHKEGNGNDHVALAWQPPGQARTLIPDSAYSSDTPEDDDQDDDNLPAAWELEHGFDPHHNGINDFHDGQYGDPDGDGLDNLAEYQNGTDPRASDTDGDGLSDHDEVFHYGTNPAVPNTLQTAPIAGLPSVHQYTQATGGWTANADGTLSAHDRRGEITYTFTITEPGVHEIVLTGSAEGSIRPVERLPITLTLDGTTLISGSLVSIQGASGTIRALTPLLSGSTVGPTTHTLTILHDNYRAARHLKIHGIQIHRLGGDDLDEDGVPDWALDNARTINSLTRVPAQSRTSPVSIEGRTQNLAAATLTYTPYGASAALELEVTPSIDDTFFADLPLSETGATTLAAHFLSETVTEDTRTVTWQTTNPFDFQGGELHIRKGDSLLLDAWSGADPDGQPFTIALGGDLLQDAGQNTNHSSGSPFAFAFNTAGTFTLTASHGGLSATLQLHIHSADFGPAHSVRAYSPRAWTPHLLGPTHLIEGDSRLSLAEIAASQAGSPRSFRAAVHQAGNRHTIARLPHDVEGAPGAILARGTIHGFYLAHLDETTDPEIIHRYDDGTWLMRSTMVAVNLPSDVLIRLTTILQGTVFQNGSNILWLDSSHFNDNGIGTIYYEWAGSGSPRLCNRLQLFLQQPD